MYKSNEIFKKTFANEKSIAEILEHVPEPFQISINKMKRHHSIVELNKKIISFKLVKEVPTEKSAKKKIDEYILAQLAPRLMPDHQDLSLKKVKSLVHVRKVPKVQKRPEIVKKVLKTKHNSIFDYVNCTEKFEGVLKKLGHTRLNPDVLLKKKSNAKKIREFYNKTVIDSNFAFKNTGTKLEKRDELPQIDKARNINEVFDMAIREFHLEEINSSADSVNLFDIYMPK